MRDHHDYEELLYKGMKDIFESADMYYTSSVPNPADAEELMELIGMCDRIIIMKDGKINGELERNQDLNENSLITMMV